MKVQNRYLPEQDFKTLVDPEPGEGDEQYFEPSPLRILGLAEIASLVLFGCMILVWTAIGDVNFPEVPQ